MHQTLNFYYGGYRGVDAHYSPAGEILVLDSDNNDDELMGELQYGHCQCCGTSKVCKIDLAGNHHVLSNGQQHAWACSLAAGMHNVTLKTPPQADLFAMFFKKFGGGVQTPTMAPAKPGFGNMGLFMGMNPYAFMPWGSEFPHLTGCRS
ncbi:hypothetical protein B0H11DRAFT_1944237 [Mycena galericulata]|nr:hypothetical protein B0H11DRAFT_1944237 [Mycena galericulata]